MLRHKIRSDTDNNQSVKGKYLGSNLNFKVVVEIIFYVENFLKYYDTADQGLPLGAALRPGLFSEK